MAAAVTAGASDRSADELYAAKNWLELSALRAPAVQPIHQAAAATALLRPESEKLLRAIIRSAPDSADAAAAHRWLTHLFVDTAQYQKLAENLSACLASFPNDLETINDQKAMAPLLEMPDQRTEAMVQSTVKHDGGLFIPVVINGVQRSYFIDTGAVFSAVSESEARQLGLVFANSRGSAGTSTSQKAGFRAAFADVVEIGGARLRSVTFAVFPDEGEPWKDLPEGRRGLLGLPVHIAMGKMRWSEDGTFSFAGGLCLVRQHNQIFA